MTALEARKRSINSMPPTEWGIYNECKSRCMAAIQTQTNLGRFEAVVLVYDNWQEFGVLFPVWRELENSGYKITWDLDAIEVRRIIIRW